MLEVVQHSGPTRGGVRCRVRGDQETSLGLLGLSWTVSLRRKADEILD